MNFDIPPQQEYIPKKDFAAIRYKDEIFTGMHHAEAAQKLWAKYPELAEDDYEGEGFEEGFVTNTNRFVSREEAGEIALKNKQLDHIQDLADKAWAATLLDSEDIQQDDAP